VHFAAFGSYDGLAGSTRNHSHANCTVIQIGLWPNESSPFILTVSISSHNSDESGLAVR
jgi:hypothetical protein